MQWTTARDTAHETQLMRKHLAGCLEDKMMRHFISKKRSIRKLTKKTELLHVYCICRMPEEEGQRMICCNNCKEWYHDGCVEIPSKAWMDEDFTVVIVDSYIILVICLSEL